MLEPLLAQEAIDPLQRALQLHNHEKDITQAAGELLAVLPIEDYQGGMQPTGAPRQRENGFVCKKSKGL